MDNSSIVAVIIVFILSFNCYGKEYELEKFSYSGADGIVHEQVLSVNTLDIEGSLDFNPTVTTVPLSIDKALMFAKKAYIEKFNNREFNLVSIKFRQFPHYFHRKKWLYVIDTASDPINFYESRVLIAVFLDGKVVISKTNGT